MKKETFTYYCDVCEDVIPDITDMYSEVILSLRRDCVEYINEERGGWLSGMNWGHLCLVCGLKLVDAVNAVREKFFNIRIKR